MRLDVTHLDPPSVSIYNEGMPSYCELREVPIFEHYRVLIRSIIALQIRAQKLREDKSWTRLQYRMIWPADFEGGGVSHSTLVENKTDDLSLIYALP
jgi:hypothetical protein